MMNKEQIIEALKGLAKTQGLYGRFLQQLDVLEKDFPDSYDSLISAMEAQKFKDTVDLVMWFESQ